MVGRWLASGLLALGFLPGASLSAQPSLGSFDVEALPADATTDSLEYGWNRPQGFSPNAFEADAAPIGLAPLLPGWLHPRAIRHDDPNDPARHVGLGLPLVGTSWRNRPWHVGWLFGGMFGDQLIDGRISQGDNIVGGYRLGWDFDHYWGAEVRYSFSNLDLSYAAPPSNRGARTSGDRFWDLNLMYYPWGDARWRPFLSLGLGAGDFYFEDELQRSHRAAVVTLPLGAGLKYFQRNWLAWRVSVTDQFSLPGQGLDSMHNIAFTAGVEMHFGGTRVGYYPYRFGQHAW